MKCSLYSPLVLQGDALEKLRELPDESAQCCVTSPPYWGLRDYGTAEWEGGDADCDHAEMQSNEHHGLADANAHTRGRDKANSGVQSGPRAAKQWQLYRETCGKCGAKRIDSQLGLEKTPEEYVAKMVEVFREVRRVLRKDGTLWLNLGSNYAGSWGNYSGENRGDGSQREIVTGSKAHQKSYDGLEKWRPPASFVARRGARACGNDGKGQSDSPASDSACFDLCDECRVAIWNRCDRKSGKLQLSEQSVLLSGETIRDNVHGSQSCSSEVVGVQESTNLESSEQRPLECSHCANCGACLSVLRSSSRDASLCARKASRNSGISKIESERHNQDKDASDLAYSTITFPEFKAKDLVPIPWMVAMALQADGWWLRSDIIWAKPNPMPESVTDRPTKSHEYIFLLTKSPRYYYDYEAILEPAAYDGRMKTPDGWDTSTGNGGHGSFHKEGREKGFVGYEHKSRVPDAFKGSVPGRKDGPGQNRRGKGERIAYIQKGDSYGPNGQAFNQVHAKDGIPARNKRSVWTVSTRPFPEAHFATYPPDLIKPCVLAGSKPGEVVLDPFAGSGTTGAVSIELGRRAILIELNPDYIELIRGRCNVTPGLALCV